MLRITLNWCVLLVLAMLIVGCGTPASQEASTSLKSQSEDKGSSSLSPAVVNDQTAQEMMQITTYQATKDAMYLVPEIHVVPKSVNAEQISMELLTMVPLIQNVSRLCRQELKC